MDCTFVCKPAFEVIGTSKTFEFDDFVQQGAAFWKRHVASETYRSLSLLNKGRPGPVTGAAMLSVYFPDGHRARGRFTDVLGVERTAGMNAGDAELFTVPPARYAQFECTYRTAMKTNLSIYGDWFTSSGYERDGSKPDIAAYHPIAFRPMGEMQVRWWIPVIRPQ